MNPTQRDIYNALLAVATPDRVALELVSLPVRGLAGADDVCVSVVRYNEAGQLADYAGQIKIMPDGSLTAPRPSVGYYQS